LIDHIQGEIAAPKKWLCSQNVSASAVGALDTVSEPVEASWEEAMGQSKTNSRTPADLTIPSRRFQAEIFVKASSVSAHELQIVLHFLRVANHPNHQEVEVA
jgi:hypothetical protein